MMHENNNPYIKCGTARFSRNSSKWKIYNPWGDAILSVNEARKFKYYDVRAHIYGDTFAFVYILRRSRRLRKYVPVYKGLRQKKECMICRHKRNGVLYQCNTCVYRMCRGCLMKTQYASLNCVHCKVGMMPWSAEL